MTRKILWILVSCLMVLSLILASCGTTETTGGVVEDEDDDKVIITETETGGPVDDDQEETVDTPSGEPSYGGSITLSTAVDVNFFDPKDWVGGGPTLDLTNQRLWDGDWSKGPAGGYGTGETDWASSYDVRAHKRGYIAETITFEVDDASGMGRIIYKIRDGVNFALNPDSPASLLLGGRDINADDVVYSLIRVTTDETANIYRSNPNLRNISVEKTAPDEVTVTVPVHVLLEAGKRFGDSTFPVPPEVIDAYGSMRDWENSVGTGPFMLKDYVTASSILLVKNPDYWMTDPVGPGQGNQLPYLDEVRWLIIPDASTRMAGLRSGKIEHMADIGYEDAALLDASNPELAKNPQGRFGVRPIFMNTTVEPYSDSRVRKAMMLATDLVTIHNDLYDGQGGINTIPYDYTPAYKDLYLDLEAPDCPEAVKELYTYNPDKARQLLADAGYPNGLKTTLTLINTEVDYYSIIADQWAKVGIELELNVLENGAHMSILTGRTNEHLITGAVGPPSIWPMLIILTGQGWQNASFLDDPIINTAAEKIGTMAITDEKGAMNETRELMKHVLAQAYFIPAPSYPRYTYWWPWLMNYSGERSIGYFWVQSWPQWIWIDENMKKSMS